MKLALRILSILGLFVVVGIGTFRAVLEHSVHHAGSYLPEARLGAMMAGLFAGGIAATILTLVLFLRPSGGAEQ